jgi:hypothetical protein
VVPDVTCINLAHAWEVEGINFGAIFFVNFIDISPPPPKKKIAFKIYHSLPPVVYTLPIHNPLSFYEALHAAY